MKTLLVLAGILATVVAHCPNGCSLHGSCGRNGKRFRRVGFVREIEKMTEISPPFRFQTNALVTTVPMVIQHGEAMIALRELVPWVRPGQPRLSEEKMTAILVWNARTRGPAIAQMENAFASKTTMERLASARSAPMIALGVVCA
jgi:hypothetical protein